VETHPVDDRFVLRQAEHARFRIPGLRTRCDRADFDEAETQRTQRIDVFAVLVQPGSKPDRGREVDPECAHRQFSGWRLRDEPHQVAALCDAQRVQCQAMRGFGFQRKQQRAQRRIHQRNPLNAMAPSSARTTNATAMTVQASWIQPRIRPASASPSPSMVPGGARRISERAACPQITAINAPTNGRKSHARMPKIRLTIAMELVRGYTVFMLASLPAGTCPCSHAACRGAQRNQNRSDCPPSTAMIWPVIQPAKGEARNSARWATSSTVP